MRLPIALQGKDSKFNISESEIEQELGKGSYWIWRASHRLHSHTPIYVCSDVTERSIGYILRRHQRSSDSLLDRKLIDREMDHYCSASIEYAKKLAEIRVTNIHAV